MVENNRGSAWSTDGPITDAAARPSRGFNRRQVLRGGSAGLLAAGLTPVAASCGSDSGSNSGGELTGELEMMAGGYTPRPATESDPHPPTMMKTLIKEYESKHKGVKIKLVEQPSNVAPDTWRVTVFQGGTEPHIFYNNYVRVWQGAQNDWYVPLNDHIEKPNPYVEEGKPGHEKWKDEIPDFVWRTTLDSQGKQYVLTPDGNAQGIFFNKTIFSKLGLPTELKYQGKSSIWENWEHMIDSMKKLKAKGYQPIALSMNQTRPYSYNWADGVIMSSTFYDILPKMGLPSSPEDPKWHALSATEVAQAIKDGVYSATSPMYGAFLDIISDYKQYWGDDFITSTLPDNHSLFINQKAPIWSTLLSKQVKQVKQEAKFDVGVTCYPLLDGGTSEFAKNVKNNWLVGGPATGWEVTERAEREGKVELAIDFLQFLTAQPQWSRLVTDGQVSVPYVKGIDVPKVLEPLVPFLKVPVRAFKDPDPRLSSEYGTKHRGLMQQLFTNQIDRDQFIKSEQALLEAQAQQVLRNS